MENITSTIIKPSNPKYTKFMANFFSEEYAEIGEASLLGVLLTFIGKEDNTLHLNRYTLSNKGYFISPCNNNYFINHSNYVGIIDGYTLGIICTLITLDQLNERFKTETSYFSIMYEKVLEFANQSKEINLIKILLN